MPDIARCSAIGLLPQRASPATETSEAWGTTAPPGVHSQKQWKVARPRDSHDDRPGHASTLLAGSRSHPIAESQADGHSYGFRRERRCADALEQVHILLSHRHGPQGILEGDIKACFDRISHDWLLTHVPMDQTLLRQWWIQNGQGWPIQLMAAAKVRIFRYVKIRSAVNPYDPKWELYLEARLGWQLTQTRTGSSRMEYLWKRQEGRCVVCGQPLRIARGRLSDSSSDLA